MSILRVLTVPDPILKQISTPVDIVNDAIRKLLDDMLDTMYAENGVGLAAIQVGIPKRMLVLDLQQEEGIKLPEITFPLFMINPVIENHSIDVEEADEGCLSVPKQFVNIKRYSNIKVRYLDYHAKEQLIYADGWFARAIQHEMDHLEGKLLIDYVSKIKRDMIVSKVKKLQKIHN